MMEGVFSTVIIILSVASDIRATGKPVEHSKYGANVVLTCDLSGPITWMKNNVTQTNIENGTLVISKVTEENQLGVYTCSNAESSSTVTLKAAAFVKRFTERSIAVTQGDDIKLSCLAWGYPLPKVTWEKVDRLDVVDNQFLNNHDRVMLMDNGALRNGTLIIKNASIDDYGTYKCIADNEDAYDGEGNHTVASATILVRVKDKFTPLWPFIGIIVEIVILLVIIVVYEKRKSKQSDSDEVKDAAAVPNSNDHNETVRLRK